MFCKKRRYLVTLLAFLGFFNSFTIRVSMSVAVIAMSSLDLQGQYSIKTLSAPTSAFKGVELSSFFYGYICTQLLGGWLAAQYGGARVYGIGVLGAALLTLITPPLVKINVNLLVVLRVIEGLFQGVTVPSIHEVWSHWAPKEERSTLVSTGFSGCFIGAVVTMPVAGVIAQTQGWEAIFYTSGVLALLWYIAWFLIVYECPDSDPHISSEELSYMKNSIGKESCSKNHCPWRKLLTSMPVWAIVVAHTCENWGYYTLLTELPTFMKETLGFDLENSGFLSCLPYLALASVLQISGRLSDMVQNTRTLSVTKVRKIFCCSSFIFQMMFMYLAGRLQTKTSIIVCLVLAIGVGAFTWSAISVNHLDLAHEYASLTMGLSNTFGTLPCILTPLLSGYIVTDGTREDWQIVFYIGSTVYLLGAVFYAIFASAERQPWALDSETKPITGEIVKRIT